MRIEAGKMPAFLGDFPSFLGDLVIYSLVFMPIISYLTTKIMSVPPRQAP